MLYEDNELYFDQIDEEDESLRHYGTPRHSGRYPWGSGENPYQHSGGKGFLSTYRSLQQKGLSDKEIAEYFHINTKALRNKKTIELAKEKLVQYDQIEKRVKEGKGWTQIARELNMSEGTVRSRYLRKSGMEKAFAVRNTADALAEEVKRNKYVDIGKASNLYMNVAEDRFDAAVEVLRKRGYGVETIHVEQGTSGNYTTVQVLTEKKVSKKEIWDNRDKIQPVGYRSEDGKGLDYKSREPIVNISRDRVMVRYSEDGGTDKDGTIEITLNVSKGVCIGAGLGAGIDIRRGRYYLNMSGQEGTAIGTLTGNIAPKIGDMFGGFQRDTQDPIDSWVCSCGNTATGMFCNKCGSKKPAPVATWDCSCGNKGVIGNFCNLCGSKSLTHGTVPAEIRE